MYGVTRLIGIQNDYVRGILGVTEVSEKMKKNR